MDDQGKKIFRIAGQQYELVEVCGPIVRGSRSFTAQFDHEAGVLKISNEVPLADRAWVVAVAVSDACFQMWKPIPVIWPPWQPYDRSASDRLRPDPEDDPPHS
jgi:hypothetical protein